MAGIAKVYNDIQFNRCSFLRNAYDPFYANGWSAFEGKNSKIICNSCTFSDNLNTTIASDTVNIVNNDCVFTNNEWDKEPPELKADIKYTVYNTKVDFKIVSSNSDDKYTALDHRRRGLRLYLAEYDNSGRLISVSTGKFGVSGGEPPYLYAYTELPKTSNYKYMIFDKNMRPIMDAVTDIYN